MTYVIISRQKNHNNPTAWNCDWWYEENEREVALRKLSECIDEQPDQNFELHQIPSQVFWALQK